MLASASRGSGRYSSSPLSRSIVAGVRNIPPTAYSGFFGFGGQRKRQNLSPCAAAFCRRVGVKGGACRIERVRNLVGGKSVASAVEVSNDGVNITSDHDAVRRCFVLMREC